MRSDAAAELVGRPRFVVEVASGASVADAASAAGVARRTGFEWLQRDDVRREIRDLRSRAMLSVASRLAVACERAVDVLIEVMDDPRAPAYAKVNAAATVLTSAGTWIELDSLAEQVEELKALQAPHADGELRAQLRAVVSRDADEA